LYSPWIKMEGSKDYQTNKDKGKKSKEIKEWCSTRISAC
jgi:hypothetical protein